MINKYQRRVSRVPVIRDQWSDHYHSFWFFHVSCFPINSFRVYLIGAVSIITFMSIAIPLRICAFSFCHQLNYTLQNWGIESESSRNKWTKLLLKIGIDLLQQLRNGLPLLSIVKHGINDFFPLRERERLQGPMSRAATAVDALAEISDASCGKNQLLFIVGQ